MMTREEVYERVNAVFADVFDDDHLTVNDDTTAADVDGWDSLTHVALIDEMEEEFDMSFDMKTVVNQKNVGEMVDAIMKEEKE